MKRIIDKEMVLYYKILDEFGGEQKVKLGQMIKILISNIQNRNQRELTKLIKKYLKNENPEVRF